jgi:ABC-2 type transport system ATP-binding protein
VGLEERAGSRIGTYSRGMRQRLGIARALVNNPVLVFLDEPTLGLDPRGQQDLLDLIQRIARERSASVVLCSHVLSEIEGICDDVIILNQGQVVRSGPVSEVLGEAERNVIHVRVPPDAVGRAMEALARVRGVAQVRPMDRLVGQLAVEVASPGHAESSDTSLRKRLLGALLRADIPVTSFGFSGHRLQDLFLEVTDEEIS